MREPQRDLFDFRNLLPLRQKSTKNEWFLFTFFYYVKKVPFSSLFYADDVLPLRQKSTEFGFDKNLCPITSKKYQLELEY